MMIDQLVILLGSQADLTKRVALQQSRVTAAGGPQTDVVPAPQPDRFASTLQKLGPARSAFGSSAKWLQPVAGDRSMLCIEQFFRCGGSNLKTGSLTAGGGEANFQGFRVGG